MEEAYRHFFVFIFRKAGLELKQSY